MLTHSLTRWLTPIFVLALLLVLFIGANYLWAEEEYIIYLSSPHTTATPTTVTGRFDSVQAVLEAASVTLNPADRVSPAMDELPDSTVPIQVQRALSVTLRTDTEQQLYWTHQPTIGAFLVEVQQTIQRTDRIFADDVPVPFQNIGQTAVPELLDIRQFLTITIADGQKQQVIRTEKQTVGEALADAGITLYAADGITPPIGQWLTPDTVITIQRSMPLTILADGQMIQTRSHHTNSLRVMADAGIGLIGADYLIPDPNTPLKPNDIIQLIRVTEDFRVNDQPIPYETLWQGTELWEIDNVGLLQAGQNGILRQRIRVRYENGVEISQTVDGEWVALPPTPEIMGYGTQIVLRILDTPEGAVEYWRKVRMRVTSYTAASSGKEADDPTYGITASGLVAQKGVVAIDPKVTPWRSHVYVPGYGVGFAGDTGGGVIGRWIDLGFSEEDYQSWSGYVDVYFLTPVPAADKINYLLPALP